jgi:hypothetical protein
MNRRHPGTADRRETLQGVLVLLALAALAIVSRLPGA